jgi:hypothetical protein
MVILLYLIEILLFIRNILIIMPYDDAFMGVRFNE